MGRVMAAPAVARMRRREMRRSAGGWNRFGARPDSEELIENPQRLPPRLGTGSVRTRMSEGGQPRSVTSL